jgi:type VI secretion system secreted protein VgrG
MNQDRPIVYRLDVGSDVFQVREISGREAISTPFRLEVRFTSEEGLREDPEELLTRGAVVRMVRDGVHVRGVAGVITEVSASAVIRGATEIRVVVEPQLALLRHRRDSRIFRDKTVPEIVEQVLAAVGIKQGSSGPGGLTVGLSSSYTRRPYTVQWRESDLDFVHRLLEDEGIYYFFREHEGLVLGDSPASYEPIASPRVLAFHGGRGLGRHDEAVTAIARRAAATVGKVALKDFNLEHPSLDLSVSSVGPTAGGPEHYDYPGEYADLGEGRRRAKLVAESFACAASLYAGESISGRLVPGHVLGIEGAPSGIGDGEHVVTSVAHAWKRDTTGFALRFETREARTTYRPPRVTPAPRILNPITGFVTGPGGEDIHTDPQGRVKVHFHWDRVQPHDDSCSHWIPVLQDNTGHSVGIPRVGWEVLVHFLEGDPDRPVVLGRMYNAADNFPNELPAGKTKSALKSMASPGRNGTNQIELDDLAGKEMVTVLAEKDQNIVVANDKTTNVNHDEDIAVVRDEIVDIGHDQTETVNGNFTHVIDRHQTRTVGGSRTRQVTGTETSTVLGNRRLTIGGMHQRKIGTDDVVQANNLNERVGAVNVEAYVKTHTTTSGLMELLTVGGALIEVAKDQKTEATEYLRVETIGGLFSTTAGEGISAKAGSSRVVTVGGAMSVTTTAPIVVDAGVKLGLQTGTGTFKGQNLVLKVGDSFVQLKDGVAVLNAKKTIRIAAQAENNTLAPGIAIIPSAVGTAKADDAKTTGKAADASGSGKTGSGGVDVSGALKLGQALLGALPKGPAQKLAALTAAGQAGYTLAPEHSSLSLRETARSYAEGLGIRQQTDGEAIPLQGAPNQIVSTLDQRATTYAGASGSPATKLQDGGLAWEKVSREGAIQAANGGDFVVAGLAGTLGQGHVATVMPGVGKRGVDGAVYPFVAGGGEGTAASDGSRTAGEVWSRIDRSNVGYFRFVPPAGSTDV